MAIHIEDKEYHSEGVGSVPNSGPNSGQLRIEKQGYVGTDSGASAGRHPEVEHLVRNNPATHKPGTRDGRKRR